MRIVLGSVLVFRASPVLLERPSITMMAGSALLAGFGILLILGIWTPIAGASIAAIEFYRVSTLRGDVLASILLGTIGCALAMLGPGLWSIDARLFGWRRVEVPARKISPVSD